MTRNDSEHFFSSALWCTPHDELLHSIQLARVFEDSKTFVDMRLRAPIQQIRKGFQQLKSRDRESLVSFVKENFESVETDLIPLTPSDWSPNEPKALLQNVPSQYISFVLELNIRWKDLCRGVSLSLLQSPTRSSLLLLPHPFIVPGSRFREMYYWDSYWVLRGLYLCGMTSTAKGILINFIHLISTIGFIPNGSRSYYCNRSQPPLFISMVKDYLDATDDKTFIKDHIESMRKEIDFWFSNRRVDVSFGNDKYKMFHYNVSHSGPRPESYVEDFYLIQESAINQENANDLYNEIKSGAESGWDFSSRWFINANGENEGSLSTTKTSFIIPVDLNAFIARNCQILGDFYESILGNKELANKYKYEGTYLTNAISKVCWSETHGIWFDYDNLNGKQRTYFYPSNLTPLMTQNLSESIMKKALSYYLSIDNVNDPFPKYEGGVPTSTTTSGQQWDFPNAWCPLEHIIVLAFQKYKTHEEAQSVALHIAKRRLNSVLENYFQGESHHFYEKYNASQRSESGVGGEYSVQTGFGWTNAVLLEFIHLFGKDVFPNN